MSTPHAIGIVTPEAVVLDLPPAGVATRLLAKLIDLSIQALILYATIAPLVAIVGVASGESGSPVALDIVIAVWVFFVLLVLPMLVEERWNGRTPGKSALGLRAVTIEGGPVHARHSMVRGLFQIIDVYLLLGLVPAMITRRSQRFGDLAAGTFVLSDRQGAAKVTPFAFYPPPGCESYVYALDVGRITERQYRVVRAYLLRVATFEPNARVHVATHLADRVITRVTPRPHQLSAEQFLHCVVSAYQYRNGGFPPASALTTVGVPR